MSSLSEIDQLKQRIQELENRKVYFVSDGTMSWDGYHIFKIFSTRKLAEQYIDMFENEAKHRFNIEEHDIDEQTTIENIHQELTCFECHLSGQNELTWMCISEYEGKNTLGCVYVFAKDWSEAGRKAKALRLKMLEEAKK